ncbi:DUF4190 domain-containing protein [Actinomadura fibrosa]|uniref:DUF4190 domain-containing protein n=1 Tax=Actinomadura fibrosa TaxID=111802 RepID=A0ABW2XQT8_9ACTN|nr:DUF4190 domain-containing protein [Actinomadura fibrosa]
MTTPPDADNLPDEGGTAPAWPPPDTAFTTPAAPAPGQPSAPGTQPPPVRRRTSRLAITALVTGLLGLALLAIGFGIAALVQTRRRNEKGRALAIAGLAAATAWLVAGAAISVALLDTGGGARREPVAGDVVDGVQIYPKVGECFDFPNGRIMTDTRLVPCGRPHEAEVLFAFDLPDPTWPGDAEMKLIADSGCLKQMVTRFQTTVPVEDGDIVALKPQQAGWFRDRAVRCAAVAPEAVKVTGRITPRGTGVRLWDDLRLGECFDRVADETLVVRPRDCAQPHDAQLTHRFEVRGTGAEAVGKEALKGCLRRWLRLFNDRPTSRDLSGSYFTPARDAWEGGKRLAFCYVGALKNKKRKGSVMPAPVGA